MIELHRLTTYVNTVPTINYGSIQAVRCVGINDNYTMGMPLQALTTYGADFDKFVPVYGDIDGYPLFMLVKVNDIKTTTWLVTTSVNVDESQKEFDIWDMAKA